MKLNPDCIRDLLLEIEESTDLERFVSFDFETSRPERLSTYDPSVLAYHLKQCDLNGYLVGCQHFELHSFEVDYLSPSGHAFLADIRSDTVWNHTKSIAGKIGSHSLDALKKIATGVVSELIKAQLSASIPQLLEGFSLRKT